MTNLIVSFLDMLINMCSSHLPEYSFSPAVYNNIAGTIATVVKFLSDANFILPLSDIFLGLTISVGLRLFKFSLFAGNWLVRRICDILP